jgi:hypothetical protein
MVRADPDSGFWFHGAWIPDPYEWLERFDDPEVMGWIEEQEASTHALLDAVPTRDRSACLAAAVIVRGACPPSMSGTRPGRGPRGRTMRSVARWTCPSKLTASCPRSNGTMISNASR